MSFRYNDGCVIARSAEAKPFVKMGEPYFKIQHTLKKHGVLAFSSNYALYGDMSQRVMTTIESMVPALEVYSIDEAFAELTGMPEPLDDLGRHIRARVLKHTGIPTGVGIAATKTLAKLANHAAKRWQRQTGGVVDIRDRQRRDKLLQALPVDEVWGIGRRMTAHLTASGIKTAWDLARADAATLRRQYSVIIEKTARELRGIPCLSLEEAAPARQEICCSRSFGQRIHTIEQLREAVASYATRACEKLRAQGSHCKQLRVSIRTGLFNPDEPRFSKGIVCELPYPTDDTRLVIHTALAGLEQIYRTGYAYAKAELLLMDLRQPGEFTEDLFAEVQPHAASRVMGVLDQINGRWGQGTLRPASVPEAPEWGMQRSLKSPSYTTSWVDVWGITG